MAGVDLNDVLNHNNMSRRAREANANPYASVDPNGQIAGQSSAAGLFAALGEAGFGGLGAEADRERDYLRRIARGEESLSAEQLRQALQQNQSAQMSMAAGARPGNAPMAARTAMAQAARLGSGAAGQQAMAGIAERQAAQQSLMNAILGQRGQDLQAALGSRQNALTGLLGIEDARTKRYMADMAKPKEPSLFDKILGAGTAIAPFALT